MMVCFGLPFVKLPSLNLWNEMIAFWFLAAGIESPSRPHWRACEFGTLKSRRRPDLVEGI